METKSNELETAVLDRIVPFGGIEQGGGQLIQEGHALRKVETQYTTAVQVQEKRSLTRIVNNVMEEARLAGKSFWYGWKVKDKKTGRSVPIEGPSIDLAMSLARNYGNCVIDVEVSESNSHFMFKGVFVDLETGLTIPRLYRQRKKQGIGSGYGDDRAEDVVFQIGQSKAQRNAVIKAMPSWLVNKAIEVAKQAETSQITNIAEARAEWIKYFSDKHNISQDRIEAIVGKPVDDWTKQDIVDLSATSIAIKEGRVSANEAFPVVEAKPEKKEMKTNDGKYGPPEEIPPDPDPDPLARENWINLRKPGYSTFVNENLDIIKDVTFTLREEMRTKWYGFYAEPWPLDPIVPGETTETTKQVEQNQENDSTDEDEKELESLKAQFADWKKDQPRIVSMAKGRSDLECNAKLDMDEWGVADYLEIIEKIGVLYRLENGGKEGGS